MPRSPETKINEPFFLLEAQNLSLFTKSSQVNRSCTMKAEKNQTPRKNSGLSVWKCRDPFLERCLWFSCRVLKRLTYAMWQNLHMLHWKYIPGGCIFKRSWVIMLPFLSIYWIWCVHLCVQKKKKKQLIRSPKWCEIQLSMQTKLTKEISSHFRCWLSAAIA